MDSTALENLDQKTGIHAWVYAQKYIIFENKIACTNAFHYYREIYFKDKENLSRLKKCVNSLIALYIEIKKPLKNKPDIKKRYQVTIANMELLFLDLNQELNHEDFPALHKLYLEIMDIIYDLGLTKIEYKSSDPASAIMEVGNSQ